MIKFENTEVIGWEAAIRGMRNPKNSWDKSDSYGECPDEGTERWCGDIFLGPNDLDLMKRLRNAGTDHRKFMRMITVYVDIIAPLYWWKEFDTYKVGTVANSCSTMHKIHAKKFKWEDFSNEHLTNTDPQHDAMNALQVVINSLNYNRKQYILVDQKLKTDKTLTEAERKHCVAQRKCFWWQMIQLLPTSYNQRRTVMMNYEVLANIYKSRKGHKLDEWSIGFMGWIKTLPYSELITGEIDFKEEK